MQAYQDSARAKPRAITLPETRPGRRSEARKRQYEAELDDFAAAIREMASTLPFRVSSRGWCYILEEHGLQKGDFDKAQRLINECRKSNRLPLEICKEDDARAIAGLDTIASDQRWEPEEFARHCYRQAQQDIDEAESSWRAHVETYTPIPWTEGLDHAPFVLVEKIDLVSLFERQCAAFHVPIANAKGWSDLHLRAGIMRYFRNAEHEGRAPVLLYCGDHDPAGLLISQSLRRQFEELAPAVGWQPDNLTVDRFGLNADFIEAHRLSWIENLQTGSGGNLADPEHKAHEARFVQDYLRRFGARKVEANALVTRPQAARELIRAAITRYIPANWAGTHEERNETAREAALEAYDVLTGAADAEGEE